jgi:hypothetical protein
VINIYIIYTIYTYTLRHTIEVGVRNEWGERGRKRRRRRAGDNGSEVCMVNILL